MRPTRVGLVGHLAQVLAKLLQAAGRNAVVLEHPLHQHGEVQHARDGVVDFVRHAGGKLAERGQAVALQQLLVRRLELLGALLHLGLQLLRELVDLRDGRAQAFAHDVERARQLVDLLAAAGDLDGLVQLHLAHRLGALDQLLDGPAQEAPREEDDEQADERDLHRGHQEHAELGVGHLPIHAVQGERKVEHPEHLHGRRMRVALGLAARGLVVDGRDHGQKPAPVGRAERPYARGQIELEARSAGGMAHRAGVVVEIGGSVPVVGVGREHHLPGAVEHADAVDALLARDGLHHLVGGLAMVVEHGVPGGAGDALGELVRPQDHGVQELRFLGLDVDQAGNRRHDDHNHRDRKHEFPGETARHGRIDSENGL